MINVEIVIRILLACGIILGGFGLYLFYNRGLTRKAPGLLADLGPFRPGTFIMVYFTSPACVPCKTVQRPAIEQVKAALGDRLELVVIDAAEMPNIASRWGVLSVPTTFVIDAHGQVRYINHGVTRREKLLQQVQSL